MLEQLTIGMTLEQVSEVVGAGPSDAPENGPVDLRHWDSVQDGDKRYRLWVVFEQGLSVRFGAAQIIGQE